MEKYKEKVNHLIRKLVLNLTSIDGKLIKEYKDKDLNIIYKFKKGDKDLFKVEEVGAGVIVRVYKNKDESLAAFLEYDNKDVEGLLNTLEDKFKLQDLEPAMKNMDDMIEVLGLNLSN